MKYVVTYEAAENVRENAAVHFQAHHARAVEFHARGDLLMIGIFADPQLDGAMGVFRTREAAEAFARDDPFVVNGVVRAWRVLEWNEMLTP
jgi:uncharacterized protein